MSSAYILTMNDHEPPCGALESLCRKVAELRTRQTALTAQPELLENLIVIVGKPQKTIVLVQHIADLVNHQQLDELEQKLSSRL